jgi:antitoxin component YwqK of YwqJK toxin-antitoxin module
MKKVLLMSAMLVAGAAMAAPELLQKNVTPMDQTIIQEKVKIEAEALPEAIKKVIAENEELKALPIAEAFQITQLDGKFQFEVIFDNGTEEKITKKYDQEGNEIKG